MVSIAAQDEPDLSFGRDERDVGVAIIILAAGRSSRMSPQTGHKLLSTIDGIPMVRHVALRALDSMAACVYAVTGFRRQDIEACLAGLDIRVAWNPDYGTGMASSLVTGLNSPGAMDHDGAMILLADMPAITADNLDLLIRRFAACKGRSIVRASHAGRPGNPVILPKSLYRQAMTLRADRGAKLLIESSGLPILDVDIGEAALIDVDTQEDLSRLGGSLK